MKIKVLIFSIIFLMGPMISFGQSADLTKVMVFDLEFKNNQLSLIGVKINYNQPPNIYDKPDGELKISLISADNQILLQYAEFDPRVVMVDPPAAGQDLDETFAIEPGRHYLENIKWHLVLPFYVNAESLIVMADDTELLRADISPSIKSFCQTPNQICDPDCQKFRDPDCQRLGFLTVTNLLVGGAILLVLILLVSLIFLIKKRRQPKEPPPRQEI